VSPFRSRQHKRIGELREAEWLTDLSRPKLNSLGLYRIGKSRRQVENQGFHDGKNRYGMEPIRHHEPHSMPVSWPLILPALGIER
jgi:hypothetical protein